MTLIDEKPNDLPSTNALDDIEIPREPSQPAYLKLGTSPYAVTDPPERGDERLYCVKLVCKGKNEKDQADGKVKHERTMHCLKMWPLGEPEPADPPKKKTKAEEDAEAEAAAADDQPPLFDDDGGASDEDYYDDGDEDQGDCDTEAEADDNVVPFSGGPSFSDNNSDD